MADWTLELLDDAAKRSRETARDRLERLRVAALPIAATISLGVTLGQLPIDPVARALEDDAAP